MTVVLFAGLAAACASKPGTTEPPPRGRPQGAVLILLDTVRADHLSCYGYERPTSPALDDLARHGAVFENAVTAAPWTLPAVGTILSGRGLDRAVTPDHKLTTSVAASIRQAGFATGAVTEGGFVSKQFGFDQGFDSFQEEEGAVQLVRPGKPRDPTPTGSTERTFARAKEWIAQHRNERFFLLIHSYEAHAPHDRQTFTSGMPPARFGEIFTLQTQAALREGNLSLDDADLRYLQALYDGGIRAADDQVGTFMDFLGTLGLRDRTLVVVTSDHGEELGDHYPAHSGDHGHSLYDELLLVPLVLQNPLEQYRVQRVRSQVRTMDIMPTVADILGVPVGFPTEGASLVPVLRGTEREGRIAYGGWNSSGAQQVFVRQLGYKAIEAVSPTMDRNRDPLLPPPPPVQLYGLQADPHEHTNLADSQPQVVLEMERTLATIHAPGTATRGQSPIERIDPAVRERLRSLGYVK